MIFSSKAALLLSPSASLSFFKVVNYKYEERHFSAGAELSWSGLSPLAQSNILSLLFSLVKGLWPMSIMGIFSHPKHGFGFFELWIWDRREVRRDEHD
jgi:hypothetical protein